MNKLGKNLVRIIMIFVLLLEHVLFVGGNFSVIEVFAQDDVKKNIIGEIDNMRGNVNNSKTDNSFVLKNENIDEVINKNNIEKNTISNKIKDKNINNQKNEIKPKNINLEIKNINNPEKKDELYFSSKDKILHKDYFDVVDELSKMEKSVLDKTSQNILQSKQNDFDNNDINFDKGHYNGNFELNKGLVFYLDGLSDGNLFYDQSDNGFVLDGLNNINSEIYNNNSFINFDGLDDYLSLNKKIVNGYPFTISVWVKDLGNLKSISLFNIIGTNGHNYGFGINNHKIEFFQDGKFIINKRKHNLSLNTWHHVVVDFISDNNRRLYIDGKFVNLNRNKIPFVFDKITIGKFMNNNKNTFFHGNLDEIRIYNKKLSVYEIRKLYDLGINLQSSNNIECLNYKYNKDLIRSCMKNKGNLLGTGAIGKIFDNTIVIENQKIDMKKSFGRLKISLSQKTINDWKGKKAEYFFDEDTVLKDDLGNFYTGIIDLPEFLPISVANNISTGKILSVIKIGPKNKNIFFEKENGEGTTSKIRIPVLEKKKGDIVVVYYSHDEIVWKKLLATKVINIKGNPYIEFNTNHFTYFAVGTEEGSFLINNGDLYTDTTGVILYNNIQNISEMKYGNTTGEVISTNWESFSSTKNRFLTTGDGTKVVYAMFKDSSGNTGMISDSIILDSNNNFNWNNFRTLPVTDGLTLWFDADDKSSIDTGAGNLVSVWKDKSSNNYNAVQGDSSKSPELQDNIIRTRSALYFDGSSDYLPMSGGLYYQGDNVMSGMFVCSVFRANSNGHDNDAFLDFDRSEYFGFYYSSSETVGYDVTINGTKKHNEPTSPRVNDDIPHIACASYNNTLLNDTQIILDGTIILDKDNTSPGDYIGKAGSTRYGDIGDGSESSSYDANRNNKYYKGYIGEIVYFDKPISSLDQKKIQCYLSSKWGIDLGYSCEHIPVNATIVYDPNILTTRDVKAYITGYNITVMNNSGSNNYIFTGNGVFTYLIQDEFGNMETVNASIDWITGSLPTGNLIYENDIFQESLDNDGTIGNNLILNLSGDVFSENVENYVNISNIPNGLSSRISYISGTQIEISLTGSAYSHNNSDDVELTIEFLTGAFLQHYPDGVGNFNVDNIKVDFYDPFSVGGFYSVADTLLDADTEPANGCDNGVCQQANYGALNYMGASDFGSVSLIKFDLSSIPTGSVVVSASLELTRMDIGSLKGTGFELSNIINNPGWIEGVGNGAGSNADQALPGEPNYKQRKWTQENWYNGNPGLISNIDYSGNNLLVDSYFDTIGEETKTFNFNSNGISVLQNWLDNSDFNQGFTFMNADKERVIIYSKEEYVTGRRPQLFVNYILDTVNPKINTVNPVDNSSGVLLDTNLFIDFDENIYVRTGYKINIKRLSDDSLFEVIDAGSENINISGNFVSINLSGELESNTGYYIQIDSGAFVDRANNAFTGIYDNTSWNFTTINLDNVPILTGAFATGISQNTGILGGEIVSIGGGNIVERGIYWNLINGFDILNGTKISEFGNWDTIGDFSLPIFGLPAGSWIYYRAFGVNSFGTGYSDQESFLTKPDNPVLLPAEEISNRSFLAKWENVEGADNYLLYVSEDSGFNSFVNGFGPKSPIFDLSYSISNLNPETKYFCKVIAQNSAGQSLDSNIISLTTTYLPIPVMHLKLEEAGGSIAYDSVGTHDAILDGTIGFQQDGIDNYGFYFNGSEDQMTTVDFNYGPNLTLEFWFKDNSNTSTEYLFSHGGLTDTDSINVILDGTDNSLKTYFGGQLLFTLTGQSYNNILDNDWHMYTLTVDDNFAATGKKKIAFYIDGQQVAVNSNLSAGAFNPGPQNLTMGRRSENTDGTYYDGYLDDIRIYSTDLFDYEVESIYNQLYTSKNPPYIQNTVPLSGENDVLVDKILEIEFSKEVNHASVENTGVIQISPSISGIVYSWSGNTLFINHDDFQYLTNYNVSISTGVLDLSGVAMEENYDFNFTTQNNIYLTYLPDIFEESLSNDGSIKNYITINLSGDLFSSGVISSGYINLLNVPDGLTGSFTRISDNEIKFFLTGKAFNHSDLDDINNLTIEFLDGAFVSNSAVNVSNSTKNNLEIDFNDPNTFSLYPIKDTTLDNLNPNYNYGISDVNYIGGGSFVLIKFDLTALPAGATINSAVLSFSKLDGAGTEFFVGRLINNSGRIEGTKIGDTASNGESTYNERNYNISNWFGSNPGLGSGIDYDSSLLIDNISFNGNETRTFNLNSLGISVLSGWFANPETNEGFVLYGGNNRLEIGSNENSIESFKPKLLISYTPFTGDNISPTITGIISEPTSIIYNSGFEQNISVNFESDEYPIYLTYNIYDSGGNLVDTTGEFLLSDSGTIIPDYVINSSFTDGEYQLYYDIHDENSNYTSGWIADIVVDTISPTTYVEYYPDSGSYISGNVSVLLTGFSETGIVITNNGGSATYIFTGNGNFIFEFIDLAGNTGSYEAVVDRIYNGAISIGAFSGFTFSTQLSVANYEQILEENMNNYFWLDDPNGYNSGYYTTLSISNLSGSKSIIPATNVYLQASGLDLLSGTDNPNVYINPGLINYQEISNPITLIQRDDGENNYITGRYGVKPNLKIIIPAFQSSDEYQGVITYTLYEN